MHLWRNIAAIAMLSSMAFAQAPPAPRSATPASDAPKNLDRALTAPINFVASHAHLMDVIATLRDITQTNIVPNWNALSQAGITRSTQVTLYLKAMPYEQVVRTLTETLPSQTSRANYIVGDNALEITTNADLGKGNVPRFYDLARVLSYSLVGTASSEDQQNNAKVIEQVIRAELTRAGEPLDAPGHTLAIKARTLAASLSERGHTIVVRASSNLNQPLRIGQPAMGTSVTAAAKKAQDILNKIPADGNSRALPLVAIVRDPAKYAASINIVFLPGAREEATRANPEIGYVINDSGVVLLGPPAALRNRTFFAVYDLRDLIKRLNFKSTIKPGPPPTEYQTLILKTLNEKTHPDGGWGELASSPSSMTPYQGLLVVFAAPDVHRAITAELLNMNK